MFTHLSLKSRNSKTGPIPVSTTSASTCALSCAFNHQNEGGCYAESNFHLRQHWNKVSSGKRGHSNWSDFTAKIAKLRDGQLWRHNQAGDLPGDGDTIDTIQLSQLVEANKGRRGFTYTHKPLNEKNAAAIADANANGFTINLSANNMAHADELAATEIGPVVVVLPIAYQRTSQRIGKGTQWTETVTEYRARVEALGLNTPKGARVEPCPATYRDDVNCASCKLCQVQHRKVMPGFPAHGAGATAADAVARAA
jgi:hypothetical protein